MHAVRCGDSGEGDAEWRGLTLRYVQYFPTHARRGVHYPAYTTVVECTIDVLIGNTSSLAELLLSSRLCLNENVSSHGTGCYPVLAFVQSQFPVLPNAL